MLAPDPSGVPLYLANLPRWVLWREVPRINRRTGETTKTKVPISYHTGKACDVTDPQSWTDFAKVGAALKKSRAWDGFGIVLVYDAERDEYVIGIDADACLDPETGAVADWAMPFLVTFGSYTEYSPSGTGLKCLVRVRRSDFPLLCQMLDIRDGDRDQARTRTFGTRSNGAQHVPGVQMFLGRRYFTITGRHWHASPEEVTLLSPGKFAQLAHLFGPREQRNTPGERTPADDDDSRPDDATRDDKLRAEFLRNPKLRERWEGGTAGLSDTSRSGFDMSIVGYLRAAGWRKGETCAALLAFRHGKLAEEQDVGRADRYFDRMWARSAATPRGDLEPPEGWERDHPPADEVPSVSGFPDYQKGLPRGRKRATADDYQPPSVWPEPIELFAIAGAAAPEVTAVDLPAALWPFVNDTAERMGVARSSVALCAIVSCAAVISDEWRLQPKRHDYTWTENPRPWGALVGPPSILKTPVVKTTTKPVEQLEIEAEERWKADTRAYEAELEEWQAAKDKAKTKAARDALRPKPRKPRKQRYLVESTTIEALQEVLRTDEEAKFDAPAGKVLMRQDELSEWLANMDRYHAGRAGGDRGAFLRTWNGGRYSVDRIGRGSFSAANWSVCALGGIQPEPIQQIAKGSVDDGLLQRFLFDVPLPYQGEGADRTPDHAAIVRYRTVFTALAALHPSRDGDGHPQVVHLHAAAQQHRHNVEVQAKAVAMMPDTSPQLRAALGKWPGYFARLCLTFHLIEVADARAMGDMGPPMSAVSAEIAERVERYMCDVLLPHLLRAYALMFATTQTGHARWVAGHILAHGLDRITVRDIVRAYGALSAPEARGELDSVMACLTAVGWLDPETPRNPLSAVSAWQVNPAIHLRFALQAEQERAERQRRIQDVAEAAKAAAHRTAQRRESP